MFTSPDPLHMDYNDFHKLCLDALLVYCPDYKGIKYVKVGNKLRVRNYEGMPKHILHYWIKRNGCHESEGLAIDGFAIAYTDLPITDLPHRVPDEYNRMLNALFPDVVQQHECREALAKMHPDYTYYNRLTEEDSKEYQFSYKSFKEVFEYLKSINAIVDTKHEHAKVE